MSAIGTVSTVSACRSDFALRAGGTIHAILTICARSAVSTSRTGRAFRAFRAGRPRAAAYRWRIDKAISS